MAPAGKSSCHWDLCINEIIEGLYLGSVKATTFPGTLDDMGITHILSLGVRPQQLPNGLIDSYFIDIGDTELEDITPHLPAIVQFISEGMARGKVLVHCLAGSSRSGSAVIGFLMAKRNWGYMTALRYVQSKR